MIILVLLLLAVIDIHLPFHAAAAVADGVCVAAAGDQEFFVGPEKDSELDRIVIGIIAGGAALLFLILVCCVWCCARKVYCCFQCLECLLRAFTCNYCGCCRETKPKEGRDRGRKESSPRHKYKHYKDDEEA